MPFFVLQLVITCLTQYMSQFKYCVICIWRLPIVYGAEGVWVVGQEDSVLYEHGCSAPGVAGRCCLIQGTYVGKGKQSVCTTSLSHSRPCLRLLQQGQCTGLVWDF